MNNVPAITLLLIADNYSSINVYFLV